MRALRAWSIDNNFEFVRGHAELAVATPKKTGVRSALASRDIIGQAKGVVMERFSLDAVEAFELLSRLSPQSNTRPADVAKALLDSEHPLMGKEP
jgi:AmiR/NasT family two-component response regulator